MNELAFTKVSLPYGWMGNMAPYPIDYNGKLWRTTEALFQAMRFSDLEIQQQIQQEKSPMAAKMKAKKMKASMTVAPLSEQDLNNMRLCLKLKLEQHPILQKLLLETGYAMIYEDIGNRAGDRHLFWGAKKVNGIWTGQNHLGKIWMEFREQYQKRIFGGG